MPFPLRVVVKYTNPHMITAYYFGRFDPIHKGHIALIDSALKHIPHLQQLVIVPAFIPPHKTHFMFDFEVRCKLVLKACLELPEFEKISITDIERSLPIPSYTIHTLEHLIPDFKHHYKDIPFIMGQDSYLNLASWKQAESLIQRLHFWVAMRPGTQNEIVPLSLSHADIKYSSLTLTPNAVSSSEIREAILAKQTDKLKEHLSASVLQEIQLQLA